MKFMIRLIPISLVAILLVGCATVPTGPRVMVLPAQGKPFEVFQEEDFACRRWAEQQIGLSQEAADREVARSAAAGTAIGAGIGAAIGSTTGKAGGGAAIGAGYGFLAGLLSGQEQSRAYGWEAQWRYDMAYQQCMYAKGNQVPGYRPRSRRYERVMPPPPPPDFDQWQAPPEEGPSGDLPPGAPPR